MKHLKLLMTMAVTVLLFSSCGNNGGRLEQMIPQDALGVFVINVPQVIEKTSLATDGKIVIPDQLSAVIDSNDAATLSQVFADLPYLGIDLESKVMGYLTDKTFGMVVLASLADEQQTKETLSRRLGENFADVEGVSCIYRGDYLYAISEGTLMVGRVNKAMDVKKAAHSASGIFTRKTDHGDDSQVSDLFKSKDDLCVYLRNDGLKLLLNKSKTYGDIAMKMPLVKVFTESDLEALVCKASIGDTAVTVTTKVIADENSDYKQLLTSLLAAPSADYLKAIPSSMEYIVEMSVQGEQFVALPQVALMLKMFGRMPYIGRLDLSKILKTIDGPVAVGMARDPNLEDEWNMVVVARTQNPQQIIDQIGGFATALGQAPEIWDGEHVYQYENKMIKVGQMDKLLYIKMLDYDQKESSAYEVPEVRNALEKNPIGAFGKTAYGTFSYGMGDPFDGSGRFVARDPKTNPGIALLCALCSIAPDNDYDGYDSDEKDDALDAVFGTAIDKLQPLE